MPGTPFFFPDNTVLINLAILDRVDLLSWFLRGRGRWCASVEWEWRQSVEKLDLQSVNDAVHRICGNVLHPTPREHLDIDNLVRDLKAPTDPPDRHRGEAETVVLISSRVALGGSVFISDDMGALQLAERKLIDTRRYTTVDILVRAEIAGRITTEQAHDFLRRLRQKERRVRPADTAGYDRSVAALRAALARSKGLRDG